MATLTITIADSQTDRVFTALSPGNPTGAAAKAVVIEFIKNTVVGHERREAIQAAKSLPADADVT